MIEIEYNLFWNRTSLLTFILSRFKDIVCPPFFSWLVFVRLWRGSQVFRHQVVLGAPSSLAGRRLQSKSSSGRRVFSFLEGGGEKISPSLSLIYSCIVFFTSAPQKRKVSGYPPPKKWIKYKTFILLPQRTYLAFLLLFVEEEVICRLFSASRLPYTRTLSFFFFFVFYPLSASSSVLIFQTFFLCCGLDKREKQLTVNSKTFNWNDFTQLGVIEKQQWIY